MAEFRPVRILACLGSLRVTEATSRFPERDTFTSSEKSMQRLEDEAPTRTFC